MTPILVFDMGLMLLVLGVAAWTIAAREKFAAVVGFVAYGLLLALAWVRLSAIDIALTEAAIGSGVTGVLLLRAASRLPRSQAVPTQPSVALRGVAALVCAAVSAALATVVLSLPDPAPSLAPQAVANMPATGLGNPVTAVLLAYRAIDTFLEKVVLVLALVGVWSLATDRDWGAAPLPWRMPERADVLTLLAQVLPPVGVVVAVYILWTGANHPGGAFQASAILAAMWMLTLIAGLSFVPRLDDHRLRRTVVAGAAVFLLVGLAGFCIADGFLAYPPGYAKALIIAIEVVMTVAVAMTLALLVAGPSERGDEG